MITLPPRLLDREHLSELLALLRGCGSRDLLVDLSDTPRLDAAVIQLLLAARGAGLTETLRLLGQADAFTLEAVGP